ncbi:hypothetical protein [Halopiger aswanensis]|uniref:Uncharacterized protein n=1 Tax=Halopiger aswanensis TaxID=148449 RepID=A0A3R7EBJ3_9EURY|nr:hypothetical protein [Halopiger aswanensis]RKD85228.1 hypothetical protein ATJ93_4730 [Halopiger aswanensis]
MVLQSLAFELSVVFFGAVSGVLSGQFLVYYRNRKEKIDQLNNLIGWLERTNHQIIFEQCMIEDSFIWQLHEQLLESYSETTMLLNDRERRVLENILTELSRLKQIEHSDLEMDDTLNPDAQEKRRDRHASLMKSVELLDYPLGELSFWQAFQRFIGIR